VAWEQGYSTPSGQLRTPELSLDLHVTISWRYTPLWNALSREWHYRNI